MNVKHAGFSPNWSRTRRRPAERPLDLSGLVERLVWRRCATDLIYRRAERAFPPADLTPAGRRAYREVIARLIVRYRHGDGHRQAGGGVVAGGGDHRAERRQSGRE